MQNKTNEILKEMIKNRHDSSRARYSGVYTFQEQLNENTTLDFFAGEEIVYISCCQIRDYIKTTLKFLDFDAKKGVEEFVFTFNHYKFSGFIDKRRAFTKEEMIFNLQVNESQKDIVNEFNIKNFFLVFCSFLSNEMLLGIDKLLKKENTGVSLTDFGYEYYQ